MTERGSSRALLLTLGLIALAGGSGATERDEIDRELASGIDFRSYDFAPCLEQASCTVGNLTLNAERLEEITNTWVPATIYWDPIDGVGVRDGAQNDEIDFDERIRIEFAEPVAFVGAWISDLFHTEDPRYGSTNTDKVQGAPEDAEIASMSLFRDAEQVGTYLTVAEDSLPEDPFNQEILAEITEDGDLLRRVVINEELFTLVVPGEYPGGLINRTVRLGEVDEDRQALFEGLETVEIDLDTILSEFHDAPLFVEGTRNFEIVRSWAQSAEMTRAVRAAAESKRTSIDISNGEIRWDLAAPERIDSIVFSAPFDASNDYSVAGLMLSNGEK